MVWLIVVGVLLLVVLVVFGAWGYQRANRLDRLNVRYDLSWQALDSALARRAVVARAVAIDAYGGSPEGERLAALADAAERAPRSQRETAENELSAALALVDPASVPAGLVAELADAEARVLLARRFHNDAVRDTLVLAERRMVRLFHLGGRAPLPSSTTAPRRGSSCSTRTARCCCCAARIPPLPMHRGGGSPSAAKSGRGSDWPKRPRVSWPRKPVCRSRRLIWSDRYGGATRSSSSTAR
jgi:hypothetical protein